MAKTTKTTKTPAPKADAAPKEDDTLNKVLRDFGASRTYTENGFWDTWSNCWKLYNNERVSIGYDGFADTFIPETYTEVQGIKSHIVNGNIQIEFLPTHPDQTGDTDTLQDLFNYAWQRDGMSTKLDATITEYLVTGNCYIWSAVGENGLPTQRVVSAKDCFFDPNITSYQDLCAFGYGGYRYLTTIDDLKDAKVVDGSVVPESEDKVQLVPRYKNLDKVGDYSTGGDDKTAKQEREEMLGDSVLEDTEGMVECILYFDSDRMITVANRTVVIEDVANPFQRKARTVQSVDDQGHPVSFEMPEIEPFIPVAPFRNLVDTNLWYARGDVEIIAASQERLNDVQAQKSDNLTYQLNRMWALDPNFAQKLDEIQSVPGAVFTIPPGALEQIPTQPIGGDADMEIARIKQEMMAASGSNELIMGQLPSGRKNSVYAINADLILLGARFKVKIQNLEAEAMSILAMNMWKIMQIYIDKEIPIRVTDANNTKWSTYNPGLYLGDWDVQVKLGATADSIKETQRQQAMQFYLLASKQPFVDQQGLFMMAATQIFDISKREVSSLIQPPPATPPPTVIPKLIENIKFTDLYPDEQGELLAESGVQPSPLRQERTGIQNSAVDPAKVANNAAMMQGGGPAPQQAFEQAGMQTAGSPPVGAPTSGVANIPRVPS